MKTIAVIEDDSSIGNLLEELLTKEGYIPARTCFVLKEKVIIGGEDAG